MVASRVTNIKSGWKGVFVVIDTAASQTYQPLVVAAFELLVNIMEHHFKLLTTTTDTMDDCVKALVAFGCNNFTSISLRSIHFIIQCCDHLGNQQVLRREKFAARLAQAEANGQNDLNPDANGSPGRSRGTSTTESNGSAPSSPVLGPANGEDTDLLLSPSAALPTDPNDSMMQMDLKIWFLALTGLSRMVLDHRVEVRTRALHSLFHILTTHGTHFSASTWRAVFHGVLFPIFDDVRHSNDIHKKRAQVNGNGSGSESSTPVSRDESQYASTGRGWSAMHHGGTPWRNPNNWNWPVGGTSPRVSNRAMQVSQTAATAGATMPRDSSFNSLNGLASSSSSSPATQVPASTPSTPVTRAIPALPPKPPATARLPTTIPPPVPTGRAPPNKAAPPVPSTSQENSWLQTTCFSALATLVELFDHFYPSVAFMLSDLLVLIHSCISQESEDLARIGVRCFIMLMNKVGSKLSISAWWIALESLAEITQRTMPIELMTSRLRSVLGLPDGDSNDDNQAEIASRSNSRAPSRRNSLNGTNGANAADVSSEPTPAVAEIAPTSTSDLSVQLPPSPLTITPLPNATASPIQPPPSPAKPSLSPLPPPTAGATPSLPFSSHIVVGKFRVQLQLLEALFHVADQFFPLKSVEQARERGVTPQSPQASNENEHGFNNGSSSPSTGVGITSTEEVVLGQLTCDQLFFALDILSSSLSFARSFNLNLQLRRKLYSFGFQTEQTVLGRLPQLFLQETRATRLYLHLLFRLIREGGTDESVEHEKAAMDGQRWMELQSQSNWEEVSFANVPTPPQPSYHDYVRLSEIRCIGISLRFLSDYVSKSVSGQMVSLEFSEELLSSFLDNLTRLSSACPQRFQNYLSIFYFPLVQLIPFGRDQVRQHLGKLFQLALPQVLPFNPVVPYQLQPINAQPVHLPNIAVNETNGRGE